MGWPEGASERKLALCCHLVAIIGTAPTGKRHQQVCSRLCARQSIIIPHIFMFLYQ